MLAQDSVKPVIFNDTTSIQMRAPSKAQENEVFNDLNLKQKKEELAKPGLLTEFINWLSRKLFKNVNLQNLKTTRNIIIWTIIIASFIIVIVVLWRSELIKLTRPKPKATAFSFTDITEDLSLVNFDKQIEEALQNSDYRLATRWHYLKTLFLLDKHKHIQFVPYKTNIDYRYEIKDKTQQNGFTSLSRIYEYAWYGQFVISEDQYKNYIGEFNNYQKQISV